MTISDITVTLCECRECRHKWFPRKPIKDKTRCPSCGTGAWNRPARKAGRPRKWLKVAVS